MISVESSNASAWLETLEKCHRDFGSNATPKDGSVRALTRSRRRRWGCTDVVPWPVASRSNGREVPTSSPDDVTGTHGLDNDGPTTRECGY